MLVAALSAFTSSHRLATPSDIPSFASYYVILYYIWVSQVFYDIRYEGMSVKCPKTPACWGTALLAKKLMHRSGGLGPSPIQIFPDLRADLYRRRER